jgi:long-chain-alcohol oxidase
MACRRPVSSGVVDAMLGAVAANPRAAERRQLARLLTLWDTAPLTGLGGGGLRRFSALDQAQREGVLLSWCDSRLPQRRAAFQALRNGSLLVSYMLPNPDGSPNPLWDAMGFPGPLGKKTDAAPKSLKPLEILHAHFPGGHPKIGTLSRIMRAADPDVIILDNGRIFGRTQREDNTGPSTGAIENRS